MAIPKKGARKLQYQGKTYAWYIRQKPTYSQALAESKMTLAIQLLETDTPCVLHVALNVLRPDSYLLVDEISITPKMITEMIHRAIQEGWQPE